jgi:protein CpxP
MNTEKSKLLWIAVIGLLLLNFSTLAFIWFHHPPGPHGPEHGNVAEYLIHELKLNDEQVKKFEELKENHHEKIEKIQHELRELHKDFFNLMKTDSVDSLKVNSVAETISSKQKEIELVTFNHFADVRKICTAEQKKIFDNIIDDAMRMMAPRPSGPPGR